MSFRGIETRRVFFLENQHEKRRLCELSRSVKDGFFLLGECCDTFASLQWHCEGFSAVTRHGEFHDAVPGHLRAFFSKQPM